MSAITLDQILHEALTSPLPTFEDAACRDADPELFFPPGPVDNEPAYPDPRALVHCNLCSIRVECLSWALARGEVGTWGGTTTYQRRQLKRPRARKVCPTCGGSDIVPENGGEVCLRCGQSWATVVVANVR